MIKLHTLPTLKTNGLIYSILVYVGKYVGNVGNEELSKTTSSQLKSLNYNENVPISVW